MHLFSCVGLAAVCYLQLLECQVHSVERICFDHGFLSLSHHLHVAGQCMLYQAESSSSRCWTVYVVPGWVIVVTLLECVRCTRLSHRRHVAGLCMVDKVRTRIIVCSVSCPPLLPEFDIPEQQSRPINYSSRWRDVEHPNLQDVFCLLKFVCGMTFTALCLSLERMTFTTLFVTGALNSFKGAVNRWLPPWVAFISVFRGAVACGVANTICK